MAEPTESPGHRLLPFHRHHPSRARRRRARRRGAADAQVALGHRYRHRRGHLCGAVGGLRVRREKRSPATDLSFPSGGAAAFLTFRSVDAAALSMDVDVLLLADPELLDGQGAPKEPITLVLGPTRDGADIVWPTGRRIDTRHATVDMLGDIQSWPFDSYTTTVVAQAYSGTEAQTELPMEFAVDGDVQGWHLSVAPASEQPGGLFFSLDTGVLALILCGIIFGATLLGLWIGRRLRQRGDTLREPLGVLQGSFLGVVGLVLAFGLALAVGRYEERRAVVVDDANAIGTAYLRAQTLPEPIRLSSLQLLTSYTDAEIALSDHVPGSDDSVAAVAVGADLQQRLWTLAGQALQANPNGNASRLYVESLNEVINLQTGRRRCDTPQHSRGSTARDHLRTRRGLA